MEAWTVSRGSFYKITLEYIAYMLPPTKQTYTLLRELIVNDVK